MSAKTVIICDSCGREAQVRSGTPGDELAPWGLLAVNGAKRDICPGCIARLGGWQTEQVRMVRPA